MHSRSFCVLGCSLVLAALAACTSATSPDMPAAPATVSGSPSQPAAVTPKLGAGQVPMEDDRAGGQGPDAQQLVPAWDDAARSSAIAAATTAIDLWARPGIDADTWWRDLSVTLSAAAREAYVGTDPTQVPVTDPGTGTLTDTSSVWLATVGFTTDAGPWTVLLSRQPDRHWLVERITAASPVHP
jgi:hypothetical protein